MEGVTARDVMSREFAGVSEGDDLGDVLGLMIDEQADDVLVLRGGDPVGHVAAHDVLRAVADHDDASDRPVDAVMRPPPEPVDADSDLSTVLARLTAVDGDHLPVANGEANVVGVISETDVVAAASTMLSEPGTGDIATGPGSMTRGEPGTAAETERTRVANTSTAETTDGTEEFSNQGVCESCGTLTGDLQVVNGQSICPECRDV